MPDKIGAVSVIGAGVGGIKAALDLAESGFQVYLIDKSPVFGGTLHRLKTWFPDNGCEFCKLLPVFSRDECSQFCLRRDIYHPNIDLLTGASIDKIAGEAGNFKLSLKIESSWIKADRCTGCGLCVGVCPEETEDEYNEGLQKRKAVYVRSNETPANIHVIDRKTCTRCGKCVEVCPTNAIDLDLPDETKELDTGAVIISTGFDGFEASKMGQYGYGRHLNVLNNIQIERMLADSGPTGGSLTRPSDGAKPKNVAFLQCVGSRDHERGYCSAACCMYALKEAVLIKELDPSIDVTIFYMDMRAFGKGYHRYYQKAMDLGVNFVRCRVSTLKEDPVTKNLQLLVAAENGRSIASEFDMAVLSTAQCPSSSTADLCSTLGVELNRWGFVDSPGLEQVNTSKKGIYVCGSGAAPTDISETVLQAGAAAAQASALLASARNQLTGPLGEGTPPPTNGAEPRISVIICQCGDIITSVVDTAKVSEFAVSLPGVVRVEEIGHLCLPESQDEIKKIVRESKADRVILAACSPYHYKKLFNDTLKEAGIDSSMWQLVNFRERIAWVHGDEPALSTDKAIRTLAVAAAHLRGQKLLPLRPDRIDRTGVVIGGGISGLTAALNLSGQGFKVHLVEKAGGLGGRSVNLLYGPRGEDVQALLGELIKNVESDSNITVHTGTEILDITGRTGNYTSTLAKGEETQTINHGAVIIATGSEDYKPEEYLYGQNGSVVTQLELQKKLADGGLGQPEVVAMIQCVGSRDSVHPWCNRSCCSMAINNAIKIKETNPETEVIIINRDIMTYGLLEEEYLRAREAGVLFQRYQLGAEPEVSAENGKMLIKLDDLNLPGRLEIEADLLALSTGIVPADNAELANKLGLELTPDGFFREVDTKFRPVDAAMDGIFICGTANAPRNLDEKLTQARAAAQRAAAVLSREALVSGSTVSEVDTRRCSACELCVNACPFKARWMDYDKHHAVVEDALCQGCGVCVALCPNSAAHLRGLKEFQMFDMIEAAF